MLDIVKPKRVHPLIVEDELSDNFLSKIPKNILNDHCEVVEPPQHTEVAPDFPDVTLEISKYVKSRSFLDASTILSRSSLEASTEGTKEEVPFQNVPVIVEPTTRTTNDLK